MVWTVPLVKQANEVKQDLQAQPVLEASKASLVLQVD